FSRTRHGPARRLEPCRSDDPPRYPRSPDRPALCERSDSADRWTGGGRQRGSEAGRRPMSATIRKTLADLRRRRLQSTIILLVVALASFAGTLALSLLVEVSGPFDRAFQQANGAHLVMSFDSRRVSLQQVAATAALPAMSQAAGPFQELAVGINTNGGDQVLGLQGRDRPDLAVDRISIQSGRWMRSSGEAVISSN